MRVIETQLGAAQMNATLMNNLKGVNDVMSKVNASMNVQEMNKIMKEFSMETEKMGMQQEMMQDQFDMMSDPTQETEAEEVYGQILSEIGMQMNSDMNTNSNAIAQPAAAQPVDDDLTNRLNALKG